MMEHTKEPWLAEEDMPESIDWNVFDANGDLVCETNQNDARRIVACVNACAGISNKQLETAPPIKAMCGLLEQREALAKQRDDLLAALEEIIGMGTPLPYKLVKKTVAAIAAAKGGA